MNGQLSDQPLAELIREISGKSLSGRLRLQHEGLSVVVYFKGGVVIYAAANVPELRLREYLLKDGLVPESRLSEPDARGSDLELAKVLVDDGVLDTAQAKQIQVRQITDVLRHAMLWLDGSWSFDTRARLNEKVEFRIDCRHLFLETGRRFPLKFAVARFGNPAEMLSLADPNLDIDHLLPHEAFLLSRLEQPMTLGELVAISGLREMDALRMIYSLNLASLIRREKLIEALPFDKLRAQAPAPKKEKPARVEEPVPPPPPPEEEVDIEAFLARQSEAHTHYEVLGIDSNIAQAAIKKAYYELARRYHPDHFRKESDQALQSKIESAFARITQAYDTLQDAKLRAGYDAKLDAQAKAAAEVERTAPKPVVPPRPAKLSGPAVIEEDIPTEVLLDNAEQAEKSFKEGLAAKQLNQTNLAISLLSTAVRLVPSDPRYHAYYGQALGALKNTRRLAESELQLALKLEPGNPDYRTMLAELYRDLGFTLRAKGEVERVLTMNPNHQAARTLLRSLT